MQGRAGRVADLTADLTTQLRAAYRRAAARIDELEQMAVGTTLISGMLGLRSEPMDSAAAVRMTMLWERVIGWVHAQSMIARTDAVLGAGNLPGMTQFDLQRLIAQEIAAATHVTFAVAMDQVVLDAQVGSQLPLSWEAMDRGEMTFAHVKALAKVTTGCTPRIAQAIERRVIPQAIKAGWTPSALGRAASKVLIAIDPEGAAERAEAAKECADITLHAGQDETSTMVATGDAITMRRVMDTIDAGAAQLGRDGDMRRVGQRRLTALANFVLGTPADQTTSRTTAEAVIVIDLTTQLGLNEHPAELSGYGPITAETARELTKDATLRRLITDPMSGRCLDLGRTRYQPSAALRRQLEARDRTCRFPGCSRRAIDCDKDHIQEWDVDGRTDEANLHCLCRMHHNLKTKKLWHVDVNPDGTEVWTSALGFSYTRPAATYPVDLLDPAEIDDICDASSDAVPVHDPDPLPLFMPPPTPPSLTDEEYEAFGYAAERIAGERFADAHFDRWVSLDLVS